MAMVPPAAATDDPGSGSDAADGPTTAETLATGTYDASLDAETDEDWYRLIAPILTKVEVTVTPDCSDGSTDTDLELYQGDGSTLVTDDTGAACEERTVHCWTNANQQLFVRVFTDSAQPGDYGITHTQTTYPLTGEPVPTPLCTVS